MQKIPALCALVLIGLSGTLLNGGASTAPGGEIDLQSTAAPASWDEASQSEDAEPDYAVVFPQDVVNRIDITIPAESWKELQAEMTEQFGEQGSSEDGMGGGFPGLPDDGGGWNPPEIPGGGQPPQGEDMLPRPGGGASGQSPMGGAAPGLNFG